MSEDTVFSPFKIKHHTIRNRLAVAPMTRMSSPGDSIPRQDVLDFLVRRAENGAGIVYTEGIVTDYESSQGYPGQARILTQRQIDAWTPVVGKIQDNGALAILQAFHCGRVASREVNPAGRTIAPSPIAPKQDNPLTNEPYPVPDEMSRFDIEHVINGFVETAKGAMAAGFDGFELHGAHGYLINQFLSSYSNKRADDYGGPLENRFRFVRELIRVVREVIPDDKLLTFRISDWGIVDMEVSLFQTKEEWQQLINLLSFEAIDILSLSTYDFRDKAFGTDQTMAQLTREVTDLPLMLCGKIYDYDSAAEALQDSDIAVSAKSFLLNPNWAEDVRARKELPLYKSADALIAYGDEALP
ncbi:MAG: NADH-dependent flavin oxidoreductase [Gammaproteobacteria bacterium]